MTEVIAIIPARAGSKSVKDKNIATLSGYPLLAYSIAVAQLSQHITRIIISTDSEQYAKLAMKYGAEVPFIRPGKFSTDDSTDRDFMIHAMRWFEANEGHVPEYWVHLRPTTPLRKPEIVDLAILEIMRHKDATSLRSGHPTPESPLKWFRRDDHGYFRGFMDDSTKSETYNLPKEAFEKVYIPDGYVDVVRASHVMHSETLHGAKMIGFESPVCVEVDSQEGFDYIRYQLDKDGSPLLEYLKTTKGKEAF